MWSSNSNMARGNRRPWREFQVGRCSKLAQQPIAALINYMSIYIRTTLLYSLPEACLTCQCGISPIKFLHPIMLHVIWSDSTSIWLWLYARGRMHAFLFRMLFFRFLFFPFLTFFSSIFSPFIFLYRFFNRKFYFFLQFPLTINATK